MDVRVFRYAKRNLERRAGCFGFAGHILDAPLDLTDVLNIVVELGAIAGRDVFLESSKLTRYGVEYAAVPFSVCKPLAWTRAISEQTLEGHTRIYFRRKRGRRRRP